MLDILEPLIKKFMPFAQKEMGFKRPPKLFLRQDSTNATDPLGKTGFYDPENEAITLYVSGRHPKDILRSLSHELMHHTQKCDGKFENVTSMGEQGYAQADPHMRTMEIEAYQASIVFRDWEDSLKETIYYEHLQKGDKKMSTKDWKNGEIKTLLTEAWGFKMDLNKLNENTKNDLTEDESDIFAPNHYCVHHGGVEYNGQIEMAEAIGHNYNKKLGRATHYDMKLKDGTILENVAYEDIQVTDASLEEEHKSHAVGKRDDNKKPDADGDGVPDWADKKKGDDNKEELDEMGNPAMGLGSALMGKRDEEDEEEDLDERHKPDNVSQGRDTARSTKKVATGQKLREDIATLLRKYIR